LKIAIVGAGVSGLVSAYMLHPHHDVTVFESASRPGGHANTVNVLRAGRTLPVDTGFIVYNERNYPLFSRLLGKLGVITRPSDMSFSVMDESAGLQWRTTSPATIFAQPGNVARPAFLQMLIDIGRFNREARRLLQQPEDLDFTLADLLAEGRWSRSFVDWYLTPMGAAIWSADPESFADFPATAFAQFFDNHGLLGLGRQPEWRTIVGGSATYVDAIVGPLGSRLRLAATVSKIVRHDDGVEILDLTGEIETFDHVVVATHSDQALRVLSDPTPSERDVLGSIGYRPNAATLHTDSRLLPSAPRARASWNWHAGQAGAGPTLTYDLSRLQGLDTEDPICLTLNRPEAVDPELVLEEIVYWHPVFDTAAMRAQRRHAEISGGDRTSYCGAYWGYGFHEDGVRSAVRACRPLLPRGAGL
jgi:predicted NAD/FAD-binding protein